MVFFSWVLYAAIAIAGIMLAVALAPFLLLLAPFAAAFALLMWVLR